MRELPFEIKGAPVPAARPRVFKNGGVAYPSSHLKYKALLDRQLPEYASKCPPTPVLVMFQFVMPKYKTSEAITHRADLDNLEKLPLDCMTGQGFWDDDYLVVGVIKSKRFTYEGEEPCTRVRIIGVDNPDILSDKLFQMEVA